MSNIPMCYLGNLSCYVIDVAQICKSKHLYLARHNWNVTGLDKHHGASLAGRLWDNWVESLFNEEQTHAGSNTAYWHGLAYM